jgi:riboflavin biosynthesis pyrimidine reductase
MAWIRMGVLAHQLFLGLIFHASISANGLISNGNSKNLLGRPIVTLKIAFDQNGAVDDRSINKSSRFTSNGSLDLVHRLRSVSDAVGVGANTVLRDNPSLTVRRGISLRKNTLQPIRVVYDSKFQCKGSLLMHDEHRTVVFTDADIAATATSDSDDVAVNNRVVGSLLQHFRPNKWLIGLQKSSTCNGSSDDPSSSSSYYSDKIIKSLQILQKEFKVEHFMLEGGPTLVKEFLKAQCVDRAIIIKAPVTFLEPVLPHFISDELLEESGLEKVPQTAAAAAAAAQSLAIDSSEPFASSYGLGGDVITCWKRRGCDWPTQDVTAWP